MMTASSASQSYREVSVFLITMGSVGPMTVVVGGLRKKNGTPGIAGDLAGHFPDVFAVVDPRADDLAGPTDRGEDLVRRAGRRGVDVQVLQDRAGGVPVVEQFEHGGPPFEVGWCDQGSVLTPDGKAGGRALPDGDQGPVHGVPFLMCRSDRTGSVGVS
jgi:hypothetical protein